MGELNKKKKHNHTLTDLLKVSIFSAVMLAPFMAIGVRCGYVMWNKNAKDSYSGANNNPYQVLPITSSSNLTSAQDLYFINDNSYTTNFVNQTISLSNVQIMSISNTGYTSYFTSNMSIRFYRDTNTNKFQLTNSNNATAYVNQSDLRFEISFNFPSDTTNYTEQLGGFIYYRQYDDSYSLDNTFSYSVAQISNDPVFNWTRNTGIYQPINAMVQGLDIENDTLQILLAYWSLMTAVYIVFDLIIFCFTKLTHFVND